MLKSLRSTGKAAIIMPHGVLFRGNAEAGIRRQLLRRGCIKGIIGLPPNLFYGTGIPACIVVLDKENATGRVGVFMIDASQGFMKDGPKNRLRPQDIHKIVDVFTKQTEVERYSRMVPLAEIADPKNDYNLNIPRYIDSSEPEDIQDLHAHLHGGIPDRDLNLLGTYWDAFPLLRNQLFKVNRHDYSDLTLEVRQVQQTILDSREFQKFAGAARDLTTDWFTAHRSELEKINADTRPNDLIGGISEDLLNRFKSVPLLDEYDVYEQLMEYWNDVMHDDAFLVMSDGWLDASRPRKAMQDKERKLTETPDLVIGSGKNAQKYKMDLIPPALIVTHYFADQQAKVDELTTAAEEAGRAVEEFIEERAGDECPLAQAADDNDKITKASATERLRDAKKEDSDPDEVAALEQLIKRYNVEAAAKKTVKEAQAALDLATLKQYGKLTEADVKAIVLDDKWQATITGRIASEVEALTLALVERLQLLGHRYGTKLAELDHEVENLGAKVTDHLVAMGILV